MTDELEENDDALLERVVTGDLDVDAPEVLARCQASPAFAVRLDDWRRTARGLDELWIDEAEVLRGAQRETSPEDARLVDETIARLHRRSRWRRYSAWCGAIAAALLLAFAVTRSLDGEADRDAPTGLLSSGGAVAPVGAVSSFDRFEIDATLGRWWRVRVFVCDSEGRQLCQTEPPLHGTEWRPDEAQLELLTEAGHIRWTFVVEDSSGEPRRQG